MRVSEALTQLDAIHDQLTKGEVYRGFQVPGVALGGVCGLAAAAGQGAFVAPGDASAFVVYWVAVAVVCALLGCGAALHAHFFREDAYARRRTRRVAGQFLPSVAAGAVATFACWRAGPEFVAWLPGAWAMLFGLGVFATRPYLPRAVGWVGLFYLSAGAFLLTMQHTALATLSGWSVGGVFGVGQLATAVVLYWNLERSEHV
jgi:hypothetical protein